MSEETDIGTQPLDSYSDTIELRSRQEPVMELPVTETSVDELTLTSADERIKQASDPIITRVDEICFLSAGRNKMESAGNSETSSLRRNHESIGLSHNRHNN